MATTTTRFNEYPMLSAADRVSAGTSVLDAALDGGALFEVESAGLMLPDGTVPTVESGKYKGEPTHKLVYRTLPEGGQHLLNVAGPGYPTSNYHQLFEMAENLFPNACTGLRSFEGGRRVMFTQGLGQTVDLGDGDTIQSNLIWIGSLDSTWASAAYSLTTRAFCANQIPSSKEHLKVKRTANHDIRLLERGAVMAFALERFEAFAQDAAALRTVTITNAQAWEILRRVVPAPRPNAEGEVSTRAQAAYDRKVQGIRYFWAEESDGPSAGTAWALLNAFQSYEYHTATRKTIDGAPDPERQVEVATGQRDDFTTATRDAIRELVGV